MYCFLTYTNEDINIMTVSNYSYVFIKKRAHIRVNLTMVHVPIIMKRGEIRVNIKGVPYNGVPLNMCLSGSTLI